MTIDLFWREAERIANKTIDSIYFNWCMFGNSGHEERPEGAVLLNYHKRENNFSSYMTKHITRARSIDVKKFRPGAMADFWHYWNCFDGYEKLVIVDVFGDSASHYYDDVDITFKRIRNNQFFEKSVAKGIINHYVFKSKQDFILRSQRSTSGVFAQQADYEKAYYDGRIDKILEERNKTEDTVLLQYWKNVVTEGFKFDVLKKKFDGSFIELISRNKDCIQSSLSLWSRDTEMACESRGAVNGKIDGTFKFHTDLDDPAWWRVDLNDINGISEVRLFNRLDDSSTIGRSARLAIDIGFTPDHLIEVYRRETDEPFGGIDGNPLIFKPTIPIPGRFVRIRLLTRNYLHLDQVEVYGEPLPNFPQPAPTLATAEQP